MEKMHDQYASDELNALFDRIGEASTFTTTIAELAFWFDSLMLSYRHAKGFTIGSGKKLYWYITPYSDRGVYRCLADEDDGYLGWPRFIKPEQLVTIHYK